MSIAFMRIDDRLIHGQVVVAWIKTYQAKRVLIVDDQVAKDDFLIGVMKMVAPSGIELVVSSCGDVDEMLQTFNTDDKNTIILVKNPYTAQTLFEKGVAIDSLNVGGMGSNPKRHQLYKNVSASDDEVDVLKALEEKGINVYFQTTPTDRQVKLSSVK